ncbi:unnamed protein product [Caenorhabditis sp. 36 PRJEB53466]|nr:unnamed protein product [Caenorhabditis sp. 36 PRJEB53466]
MALKKSYSDDMEEDKLPTVWHEVIENNLVELVVEFPSLWKVKEDKDYGHEQRKDISSIRETLNMNYCSGFTDELIMKKWVEIRMLFDLKYAMNGYKMDNRGVTTHRDGSLKDDLKESWKLFKKLAFLVEPMDDEQDYGTEKKKKGRPAQC